MEGGGAARRAWHAMHHGIVLVDEALRGHFLLEGAGASGLLHRVTTQDINALSVGSGAPALLITEKGRILDRLTILRSADRFDVLTSRGGRSGGGEALRRYILFGGPRFTDLSEATARFSLHGPRLPELLEALGVPFPAAPGGHAEVRLASLPLHVVHEVGLGGGTSCFMWVEAARGRALEEELVAGGKALGLEAADAESFEILRIASGLPALGHELAEEWNPLEARQEDALSFDKGCYVGQEIVARLRTYDKVRRRLARIEVEGNGPLPPGTELRTPSGPGTVTSAAPHPDGSITFALAMLECPPTGPAGPVEVVAEPGRVARLAGDPPTAADRRVEPPRAAEMGLARGRFSKGKG
jgi:folate-binding protein YgfZ